MDRRSTVGVGSLTESGKKSMMCVQQLWLAACGMCACQLEENGSHSMWKRQMWDIVDSKGTVA
jgi:hypothetical protein